MKTTLLAAGLFVGALAGAPASAETILNMATPWPGGPSFEAAMNIAENIEKLTGGEIKVEVHASGSLGNPTQISDAVKVGIAEMGHNFTNYDWGIDRTNVLFSGNPGGLDAETYLAWLRNGGGLELQRQYREEVFGIVAIPCGIVTPEVGMVSKTKIQTLEDLKGLKFRTSGAWSEIAPELGMSTVSVPGSEAFEALDRGLIDALEWGTLASNRSGGFHDIAKYIISPSLHAPTSIIECDVNMNVWNSFTDQQRAAVEAAFEIGLYETYEDRAHLDAEAFAFFKENGNEFVTLDDEVVAAAKAASDAWLDAQAAENEWFAKILKSQRDYKALWESSADFR